MVFSRVNLARDWDEISFQKPAYTVLPRWSDGCENFLLTAVLFRCEDLSGRIKGTAEDSRADGSSFWRGGLSGGRDGLGVVERRGMKGERGRALIEKGVCGRIIFEEIHFSYPRAETPICSTVHITRTMVATRERELKPSLSLLFSSPLPFSLCFIPLSFTLPFVAIFYLNGVVSSTTLGRSDNSTCGRVSLFRAVEV